MDLPSLPDGLDKYRVPLGIVIMAGTTVWASLGWLNETFLKITDFERYQSQMEIRLLDSQRQQLETDVLRLAMKREVYPKQFDAVDRAILQKQEVSLAETHAEIARLKRTQNRRER